MHFLIQGKVRLSGALEQFWQDAFLDATSDLKRFHCIPLRWSSSHGCSCCWASICYDEVVFMFVGSWVCQCSYRRMSLNALSCSSCAISGSMKTYWPMLVTNNLTLDHKLHLWLTLRRYCCSAVILETDRPAVGVCAEPDENVGYRFLKTELNRTDLKIKIPKTLFLQFGCQKTGFGDLGAVFHIVSFTVHLRTIYDQQSVDFTCYMLSLSGACQEDVAASTSVRHAGLSQARPKGHIQEIVGSLSSCFCQIAHMGALEKVFS